MCKDLSDFSCSVNEKTVNNSTAIPSCRKCIHQEVCENSFLKLTLYEYGECKYFLNKDNIIILDDNETDTNTHSESHPDQLSMSTIAKCAGCGAENVDGIVVASMFGASSEGFCADCLQVGKDSYSNMVNYIASAGRWPIDINSEYQAIVREQLRLHNKTEAEFTIDVDAAIKADWEIMCANE